MSRASSRLVAVLVLAWWLPAATAVAQVVPPPPGGETKGGAPAEAAPPAGTPAAAAAPKALPGPLLVPDSEFRYNPTGRRDPFKSLLQLEQKQRDLTQLPPIQQFDLESAKVVGIVVDAKRGAQAMVRSPNNQSFVVRVGTIMGKNEGEVVEITLSGIRVLEKFVDFMNRETRKETFLKSHPAAGK